MTSLIQSCHQLHCQEIGMLNLWASHFNAPKMLVISVDDVSSVVAIVQLTGLVFTRAARRLVQETLPENTLRSYMGVGMLV